MDLLHLVDLFICSWTFELFPPVAECFVLEVEA